MKAKKEYQVLLDNGELKMMFPKLSGNWKKDKAQFTALWGENKEAIKDIDVNFTDDD